METQDAVKFRCPFCLSRISVEAADVFAMFNDGAVCPHCNEHILIPRSAGHSLTRTCARCGRRLPQSAAFCMTCGTPAARGVSVREPAPPVSRLRIDRAALDEAVEGAFTARRRGLDRHQAEVFLSFVILVCGIILAWRTFGPTVRNTLQRFAPRPAAGPEAGRATGPVAFPDAAEPAFEPADLAEPLADDALSADEAAARPTRRPVRGARSAAAPAATIEPVPLSPAARAAHAATRERPAAPAAEPAESAGLPGADARIRAPQTDEVDGVSIIREDRSLDPATLRRLASAADRRVAPVATDSRPRPPTLDFADSGAALDAYLAQQPAEALAAEKARAEIVAGARAHLMKLMNRMPYEDYEKGIAVKGGRRIKGSVPFVNAREISISTGHGGFKEVKWADLPFAQIVDFLTFYIAKRLSYEGTLTWRPDLPVRTLLEAPVHKDAAKDLLLLAVLCDWYGQEEKAVEFALAARKHDPGVGVEYYFALPDPDDP